MDIKNMQIQELIENINLVYKKSKERELTLEEKDLQQKLRKKYIDNVRRNFKVELEGIEPKNK